MAAVATLRGLDLIRVDVPKLVEVLKKNRVNHVKEYKESVEGWRIESVKFLKKKIHEIKEEIDMDSLNFGLPKPQSHEKEYDRVIEMLEFTKDIEVELDSASFNQYVRDEWSWTQGFKSMSSTYSSSGKR